MPIYRDSEGKVVEEKTKRTGPKDAGASETGDFYTDQTRKIGGRGAGGRGKDATRLIGGRNRSTKEPTATDDAMEDPVVGWLVVVDGPGRGNALKLGYGTNSIGRSPEERVPLPFGDTRISRTGHAVVTYDPRGRKYYVQHGGGRNLTYLDDEPVLSPTELPDRSRIVIGGTTLCFVAFCGAAFDWQDGGDGA